MAGADEREPPLHKGVIFLEVSKEGYYRVSGYTGSKEDGDLDQILNANGQNPLRVASAAKGVVDDIFSELVVISEKNAAKQPAPKAGGKGRTK